MRWSPILCLLLAFPAHAGQWDRRKGDCDQVFRGWRTSSVDRLRDCTMRWESYRNVRSVDSDTRALMHEAFDKLYLEGDRRDAVMALSALKRLGLRPTQLRPETQALPSGPKRAAVRQVEAAPQGGLDFAPDEPMQEAPNAAANRPADRKSAERAFREGKIYLKKSKLPEAVSEFLIAADSDPSWAPPLYMAARCYVRMGRDMAALKTLQRMKSVNSQLAKQLIRKAVKDPNFKSLRARGAFKDLTGTAVIQLLNGAGEAGLSKIMGYRDRLERAGMPVAAVANDRNPRQNTYLYTKPGFEQQGEALRRQLKLGLLHKRTIDWPSQFDVILIHGGGDKAKWVDDEAEKNGQKDDTKKKEEEAKKKAEEAKKAQADKLKRQIQMMKMMQQMEAEDAAGQQVDQNDPTKGVIP